MGIATNANNYSHPTSDGSKHVPANGTTNNGKVLKAGATAGTYTWSNDNDTITTINGKTGAIAKSDIIALGIPSQDTVYTHPSTHPASMITDLPTGKKGCSLCSWNVKRRLVVVTFATDADQT